MAELAKDFFQDVNVAFKTDFDQGYKLISPATKALVYTFNVGKEFTEFPITKYFSKIREWKGQRQHDDPSQMFSVRLTDKKYDGCVDIEQDEWQRAEETKDQTKLQFYRQEVQSLGKEAADFPYERALDMILEGDTNTYGVCFDQQNLYDTTHAYDNKAGTQSNIVTGTGITEAQVYADILTAVSRMVGFYYIQDSVDSEVKRRLLNRGKKLIIMCPTQMWGVFEGIRTKTAIGGGDSNQLKGMFELEAIPADDANDWYLVNNDEPTIRPVLAPSSRPIKLDAPKDAQHLMTEFDILSWGVRFRRGFGYMAWWKTVKVTNT